MSGYLDYAGPGSVRLQIRLLGTCEFVLDGRRQKSLEAPRLQRFLALIVLREGAQHRSRLAFELWPDSTEGQARTNFRKLLHDLRRAVRDVDQFVEIGKDTVRLARSGASEIDVLSFRNATASGDFERACALYRGHLLPDCYDEWILRERGKLRDEALGVYRQLAERSAQGEAHDTTIEQTRRILALEPTDEAVVRAQIDAFQALGDRPAALRTYQRFAEVLDREFGVVPDAGMAAIYEDLRATASSNHAAKDGSLAAETIFVGRQGEMRKLIQCWTAALNGRAALVLVTGEPGIGKSRLALELRQRIEAEGSPVASTRAYKAAGRLPWGPVIDLLRSRSLRSQAAAIGPVWKAELARLLPELGDSTRAPGESQPGEVAQRHRLFDAVARAIVGDGAPRLLIIDDLQWCDTETIELIGYLLRSHAEKPVLIVATVRAEEIPGDHPLQDLVDTLERDRTVTTLALEPLDRSATQALAVAFGENADEDLMARLWTETEGNPLFIVETLRVGLSSDDRRRVLTPTMRAVLRARLNQNSDGARRLIEFAAVFGRPFSLGGMCAAMECDEPSVVAYIDELWRRRIVREHGARYDFSHDKLRDVALELITPARRRQLHKAVAQAITAGSETGAGAISARLAAHYEHAGMVKQAIEAYHDAGTQAVAVSALDEAVNLFGRAVSLLAELPKSPDRDALELKLRIAMGSPLVAVEGYGSERAHHLYGRALSLCRGLGRLVDPPILRGLGLARLQGCRFDECNRLADELVSHASGDPVARTEGLYLLGVSAFWQGRLPDARGHLEAAITSYDVAHRNEHLALYAQDPKAICLVRLALVLLWSGDPGGADGAARAAFNTATDLDHIMTIGYVLTYSAILAVEAEDHDRLRELLAQAEDLWKRLSERYLKVVLEAIRGWLEVREGSAGGTDKIVAAVARSRTGGETLHLSYTLLLLARARALRGELTQAQAAAREAITLSERSGQRYLVTELLRVSGELAHRCGDAEDAETALRQAVVVAGDQGALWFALRAQVSLVRAFPDKKLNIRLGDLLAAIPSGHDLPTFRAATDLLR